MKSQDAENASPNGGAVKSDLDEELVQNAVADPDAYRALEDGIEEARDNEEEAHYRSLLSLKAEADRRIRVHDDIRCYRACSTGNQGDCQSSLSAHGANGPMRLIQNTVLN